MTRAAGAVDGIRAEVGIGKQDIDGGGEGGSCHEWCDPQTLSPADYEDEQTAPACGNSGGQAAFLCDASACTAIPVEAIMPAKSKAQQKAAGIALSAKRGETKKSDLKGPSKSMYESMSEDQLEEMASGKRKGKPEHKSKT
jgi:hypothetical protein